MIHYLPIEHEPMRYTASLDAHIVNYLQHTSFRKFNRIYPQLPAVFSRELPTGQFLDAARTTAFKSMQLAELAQCYAEGQINDGDIVFLGDIWFPGIEAVRYLDFFEKRKVKLRGILHAGSFTDTDFVRQLERWASLFENTLFDIFDRVIVASEFIKHEVCSRRLLDPRKVVVSAFPLDGRAWKQPKVARENIVVFNGRITGEKQPELFDELSVRCVNVPPDTQWISTQALRLSQKEYYGLLQRAKCVVSFALQENFGFGILEATHCGCIPVVPDRLVYPEFYPTELRYRTFHEAVHLVERTLRTYSDEESNNVIRHVASRTIPNLYPWFSHE